MKNSVVATKNWKVLVMTFGFTMACFGPLMATEGGRGKGSKKEVKTDAIELVAKGAEKPVLAETKNVRLAQQGVVFAEVWLSVLQTAAGANNFEIIGYGSEPTAGPGTGCYKTNPGFLCSILLQYNPATLPDVSTIFGEHFDDVRTPYGLSYTDSGKYQ